MYKECVVSKKNHRIKNIVTDSLHNMVKYAPIKNKNQNIPILEQYQYYVQSSSISVNQLQRILKLCI